MAASLTSKFTLLLSSILANTVGVAAVNGVFDRSTAFSWASGVGADQSDKIYTATLTRTHGAPASDLDLAGVLTDPLGTVLTFARVKAMFFFAAAANINTVVIGGGAAAPLDTVLFDYVGTALAQPAIRLRPGGAFALIAPQATGYVVTATTADKLQIANGDEDATTTVSVDVVIIGASA